MSPQDADRGPPPHSVIKATLDVWGQAGEQHLVPIAGHSMRPSIHDGDRVLVAHGWAGVRRGDVVVFRQAGKLVAHRVVRITDGAAGPTFLTKGDNTPRFDPPLSAGEIVGRVLAVERDGRHVVLDTAAWRMVGWLIAVGTLAWTGVYGWGRDLKHRLVGPRPTRLIATLRRGTRSLFSLALTVAQAVGGRWRRGVPGLTEE